MMTGATVNHLDLAKHYFDLLLNLYSRPTL